MTEAPLWLGAIASAIAFTLLGIYVTHAPLGWPDTLAAHCFGRGIPVAVAFTVSGYARIIVVVIAAAAVASLAARVSLIPIFVIALIQTVSQVCVALIKDVFGRTRPDRWKFQQERGNSYPSGHAATAVALYGLLVWLAFHARAPAVLKETLIAALALWIAGIFWSRIALGAHYPTDVVGGALIGAAFAFSGIAAFHLD